jgi:hypothetical protein
MMMDCEYYPVQISIGKGIPKGKREYVCAELFFPESFEKGLDF